MFEREVMVQASITDFLNFLTWDFYLENVRNNTPKAQKKFVIFWIFHEILCMYKSNIFWKFFWGCWPMSRGGAQIFGGCKKFLGGGAHPPGNPPMSLNSSSLMRNWRNSLMHIYTNHFCKFGIKCFVFKKLLTLKLEQISIETMFFRLIAQLPVNFHKEHC